MDLLAINETRGFERAELRPGLLGRMDFLDQRDRTLLEMSLAGRMSRAEGALLLGMSRGGVTRRVRRLLNLLHDPLVVALIDHGQLLPEGYREVGLAHLLRGWTVRRIAREFGLTPYRVSRALMYVRAWHRANRQG